MSTTTPEFSDAEGTTTKPKKIVKRKNTQTVAAKKASTRPPAKKSTPKKPGATKKAVTRKSAATKKTAAPKKPGTSRPTAKKAAAKKATPAKKVVAKKTATKAPVKKVGAKPGQKPWGEFNIHGYRVGSDSAIIVDELLKGGKGRQDVTDRISKKLPSTKTRGGQDKNISSLISGLLGRLEEAGYKLEEQWRVVPPAPIARRMANANGQVKTVRKVATKKA